MPKEKASEAGIIGKGNFDPGNTTTLLQRYNFDIGALRPYFGKDGKAYINVKNSRKIKAEDPDFIRIPVANATLPDRSWIEIDAIVQAAARIRTPAVDFLRSRGLVRRFDGFGSTLYQRPRRKEKTGAEKNMGAVTQGRENAVLYDTATTPLPITHDQFGLEMRQMAIAQSVGQSLQQDNIEESTSNIIESVEADLLTNVTFAYGGATAYSAINHPNRNTVTLAQNWDASGKTGEEIATDVRAIVQAARNDRQFGDGVLFTPTAYDDPLDADFKGESDITVRERLLKLTGIAAIVTCDKLPANTVVWVQLSPRTFVMLDGLPITTVEWPTFGGLQTNWKLMTIQVPDFRPDYAGRLGLVVLS